MLPSNRRTRRILDHHEAVQSDLHGMVRHLRLRPGE
jgi:hypothetical protein